jgi:3',5'-cyclic AMP phosphodiesterase CpdA
VRIAWTTDLHLNFVSDTDIDRFLEEVRDVRADAVVVGGDIGEADTFAAYLERMTDEIGLPIHFVLGNHDYYKGSISGVREVARALSERSDLPNWLTESDPVWLTERTALIGHGGWGDARAADFLKSDVILNDYLLIEEFREANGNSVPCPDNILTNNLMSALQSLGDEAAAHFRHVVPTALQRCNHVLVLMHVPPFRETCWHDGHLSDDNWAPHFTCVAAGEVLLEFMQQHPQKRMTVLCGHTHSSGSVQIRDNLEVLTGDAENGRPKVQRVFDVD